MIRPSRLVSLFAVSLLALAAPAQAEKFTIAVVPDMQNYNDVTLPQPRGQEEAAKEIQYIVDSRAEKSTAFVTFMGDITQHGDGQFRVKDAGQPDGFRYYDTRGEWDNAIRAIAPLGKSGLPFGMVPGNHDYDNISWWDGAGSPGASRPLAGGRTWDYYFGPHSRLFAGKDWYGGAYGMNSYQLFSAAGKRFLHIAFEMEPTIADLDWAQKLIDANPGLPVIFSTHEWLRPHDPASTDRSNDHQSYFPGADDHQTPDQVWDRFVRKNPAIFLILAGHNWTPTVNGMSHGENLRIDKNDAGYPVYQVQQDYQGETIGPDGQPGSVNGGGGWLRFVEFDTAARKMHFYTYSVLQGRYAGRDGYLPFGTDAKLADFTLDFPPQLLK